MNFSQLRTSSMLVGLLSLPAAPTHAVMIDPDGTGEVLLYPYYSVNAGQQTLLTLVNHGNTGRAVKLHFREALNGRSALSLNLYLSEFDVWTAALIATPGSDTAALITFDNSCTVPAIKTNASLPRLPNGVPYLPFSTADFSGVRADGGSTAGSRTREGYIEAIEMGTLLNNSESDFAATHVGGVPRNCPSLTVAWNSGGYWQEDPDTDVLPPSGQISGTASMVTLTEGTVFNVDPVVLSGFSIISQHTGPNAALPDLSSAITDPQREQVESVVLSDGQILRSYWPQTQAIDAVSAALTHNRVHSEFNIEPILAARSEWIITLPTRRHYVDGALTSNMAIAPFTSFTSTERPRACELVPIEVRDRNGTRARAPSIGVQVHPCFCASVQRWTVNTMENVPAAGPSCLEHPLSTHADNGAAFSTGYFELSLESNGHKTRATLGGEQFHGLPSIGFMRTSYESNNSQTGQRRIYSSTAPQSGSVYCTSGMDVCDRE
jgi:hypothetical protein